MTPEELYQAVGMTKSGRKQRMQRMGNALVAEWSAQARQHGAMGGSLSTYVRSISIRRVTATSVTVELPGKRTGDRSAMFARMYEFGLGPSGIGSDGPFDVRRWLLTRTTSTARGKIKHGRNGPYRDVPFRRMTKTIQKLGGRTALEAARGLAATRVSGGSWQGPALAHGYTAIVNNPNTKIPHKTDRLQGLRKLVGRGGQTSRYMNFRRASWAGNPWLHRGIKARRIGDRVRREIPRLWRMVS